MFGYLQGAAMSNERSTSGGCVNISSRIRPAHFIISPAVAGRIPRRLVCFSMFALMGSTAWAGSNNATQAAIPQAPEEVITDSKVLNPFAAKCKQQLEPWIIGSKITALTTESVGMLAEIASLGESQAAKDGLVASFLTEDGVANPSPAAPEILDAIAKGTELTAKVGEQIGKVNEIAATGLELKELGLHFCNTEFTGTISGAGGTNITGNSIYNNNLGVVQDLSVGGKVNANQVNAAQGISAMGGAITIGDPNGTTYSSGITIGGGAISGAGSGGAQATTGDKDAIAIGNGANATTATSTALGTSANANSINSTAIGTGAQAVGSNSTAIGAGAVAIGNNSVALGQGSAAVEDNTVSVGNATTGTTRRITNVAPGVAPTDAVNVEQFLGALGALDDKLSTRISQTGAITAAMSQIQLPRGAYSGIGVGLGTQGGQSAIALGFVAAVSPNLLVKFTAGNTGQVTNAAAGITLGW